MTQQRCLLSKAQIEQWIKDLRSGEFPQTTASLRDSVGFCCLGVLAARLGTLEAAQEIDDEHVVPRKHVLGHENESTLIDMNDRAKKDFVEIADWIERQILPSAPEQMVPDALDPEPESEDEPW